MLGSVARQADRASLGVVAVDPLGFRGAVAAGNSGYSLIVPSDYMVAILEEIIDTGDFEVN
ncbi:MAG: hypothetical protein J4F44_08575 [Acidimicrobiia bacterium]|nr:hypothetical protein [Acidimicrobiia bacterium]